MVVGRMVRTCPVTKGFTCNTPQDWRRHVVVRRSSRSVAKLFPDVTLFYLSCMRGTVQLLELRDVIRSES